MSPTQKVLAVGGACVLTCVRGISMFKSTDEPAAVGGEEDVCKCMNWAHAYQHYLEPSHVGYEESLTDVLGLRPKFFLRQNHNYCVKVEFTQDTEKVPYPGNWCYVAAKCNDLNGGKAVNDYVSAKKCKFGEDFSLAELPPPFLLRETGFFNDTFWLPMLMAYPWQGGASKKWEDGGRPMSDTLNATGTSELALFKAVEGVRLNLLAKTGNGAWGVVGASERGEGSGFMAVYGGNDGSHQHWEVGDTMMECVSGQCVEQKK